MHRPENKESKTKRRRGLGETGFEPFGGYMNLKKKKLEEQFLKHAQKELIEDGEGSEIFSGISVFVNGYTNPSADKIKRLMMLHGGMYQHYYHPGPNCYIIASNLPYAKLKDLKDYVLKPDWIVDSIKAGKVLPSSGYYLYEPHYSTSQQKLTSFLPKDKSETHSVTMPVCDSAEDDSCDKSISKADPKEENQSLNQKDQKDSPAEIKNSSPSDLGPENGEASSTLKNSSSHHTAAACSSNPGFIKEFYNNSRLHHISTASVKLREYVHQLREEHGSEFKGRKKLKEYVSKCLPSKRPSDVGQEPVLMHIDMDCFFVSVGLRFRPDLKGKPIAVCHSKGTKSSKTDFSNYGTWNYKEASTSEIASCSYEARKAGIKNGMFLGQAKHLCPDLQVIPYDFESYTSVSKILYNTVASFTLDIEAVSCDEMYADVAPVLQEANCTAEEFASFLRKEIVEKTMCTASVGLGPNMLVARIANRSAKPNGQKYVPSVEVKEFFRNISVKDLPGVGRTLYSTLADMNITTCGDLQKLPLATLQSKFGMKTGKSLCNFCRGLDTRALKFEKERKSVSAEVNYGIRFTEPEDMRNFIMELSEEVEARLKEINLVGEMVTFKIKVRKKDAPVDPSKFMGHGLCDNIAKSSHLLSATNRASVIGKECCALACHLNLVPSDIRGVGIQVSKLKSSSGPQSNRTILSFLETETNKPHVSSAAASSTHSLSHNKNIENAVDEKEHAEPSLESVSAVLELTRPPAGHRVDSSHNTVTSPHMTSNVVEKKPSPVTVSLPSLYEIDPTVLESLPKNVQEEILSFYGKTRSVASLALKRQPTSSSSTATTSAKSSNICKNSKRGRPRGSPLKTGRLKTSPLKSNQQKPSPQTNTLMEYMVRQPQQNDKQESCIGKNNSSAPKEKESLLNSEVKVEKLKALLRDWIHSGQEIIDGDVRAWTNLLKQIISKERNLEKVDLLLRFFFRNVQQSSKKEWQETYMMVINSVQMEMLSEFGKFLKILTFE